MPDLLRAVSGWCAWQTPNLTWVWTVGAQWLKNSREATKKITVLPLFSSEDILRWYLITVTRLLHNHEQNTFAFSHVEKNILLSWQLFGIWRQDLPKGICCLAHTNRSGYFNSKYIVLRAFSYQFCFGSRIESIQILCLSLNLFHVHATCSSCSHGNILTNVANTVYNTFVSQSFDLLRKRVWKNVPQIKCSFVGRCSMFSLNCFNKPGA